MLIELRVLFKPHMFRLKKPTFKKLKESKLEKRALAFIWITIAGCYLLLKARSGLKSVHSSNLLTESWLVKALVNLCRILIGVIPFRQRVSWRKWFHWLTWLHFCTVSRDTIIQWLDDLRLQKHRRELWVIFCDVQNYRYVLDETRSLKKKNTKETIINQNGTRIVKDGED